VNEMCLVKKGCKSKVFESESGLHFLNHESYCKLGGLWIFCCDVMYRSVSVS
jgi:hypothetical protein